MRAPFPPGVVSTPDAATGYYNPFPTYAFSGSLRPVYPLSARRAVPAHIRRPDYADDGVPHSEQKLLGRARLTILDAAGQKAMRKVCRLAREVLDAAAREVRPGVSTDWLDEVVHRACLERNVSVEGVGGGARAALMEQGRHTRRRSTTAAFPSRCARRRTR